MFKMFQNKEVFKSKRSKFESIRGNEFAVLN